MNRKRQNNQQELALEPKDRGEAPARGDEETEPFMAKSATENPAFSRLNSIEPPCTDPYARWCGRGGAERLPPIPIVGHLADIANQADDVRSSGIMRTSRQSPAAMTASLLPCVTTDSNLIVRVSHPIPASRIVTVILPPGLVSANGEDHLWRTPDSQKNPAAFSSPRRGRRTRDRS